MLIDSTLKFAHKRSRNNRPSLTDNETCGCFFCLATFTANDIWEWWDKGMTAVCPHCEMDSVLPDSKEYPLTEEFLKKMQMYWF